VTAAPVAVIGTGRMGAAMVGRQAGRAGRGAVVDRDRVPGAGQAAAIAPSARAAAEGAAFVVVSLADDAAVRAVYPDLARGLAPDAVVLETSTIHPDTVRELAATLGEARLLDSPVSGSVALVEQGALTALVGGSGEALERARPVLSTFASRVLHLGPQGAGATMKLVVNSVIHGLNQAVAEALVLAERAGVDRTAAYDVLAASAVAAPFVAYKRDAYVNPDAAGVAFALDLVAKDLRLIDALATSVGARMPQLAANASVVAAAVEGGYGGRDMSALAALLRG